MVIVLWMLWLTRILRAHIARLLAASKQLEYASYLLSQEQEAGIVSERYVVNKVRFYRIKMDMLHNNFTVSSWLLKKIQGGLRENSL